MANIHVSTKPLIPRNTPYPASVNISPTALRNAKSSVSPQVASAFEATASDLTSIKSSLNNLHATLRQQSPSVQQVYVTDNTGKVIAAIGDFNYQGTITPNYFSEIHVGDPLNTGNPAQALFNAVGGRVTVGQNGIIEVLDPFGKDAAWIGAQADTLPVTGAVDNGSGLIRLTVTAHTLQTGDTPTVLNVGGVPNATGVFTVTVVDANTLDLQASVFVGTYTSGGTVNRILHVTGAANNGSGLIRLTAAAHGYTTGDEVNVVAVGGVTAATGQWIITVFDANNFDLQGSAFAGTYTSGGTCLRYFAGMLAQTFAVGPSFANYKLRAFADGSLRIRDAEIDLAGSNQTVELDPTTGSITITATAGPPFSQTVLSNGELTMGETGSGAGSVSTTVTPGQVQISGSDPVNNYQILMQAGAAVDIELIGASANFTDSEQLSLNAFSGTTKYGPVIAMTQNRGSNTSSSGSRTGDTLGGILGNPTGDGTGSAAILMVATENQVGSSLGGKIVLQVAPNGSQILATAVTIDDTGKTGLGGNTSPAYPTDVAGDVNTTGVYRKNGTQVVGAQKPAITAPAGGTTVDSQARLAIAQILGVLSLASGGHGLTV